MRGIFFGILLLSQFVAAPGFSSTGELADHAYLDPPYQNLIHPKLDKDALLSPKSNTAALIQKQTPVKAQANRGTCSMFSAIALLESLLIIQTQESNSDSIDLSEEWLEYLVMRNQSWEGSSSPNNFNALFQNGATDEDLLPYIGETWETLSSSPLAFQRCGQVPASLLKSCLLGHRDPRLLLATDAELGTPGSPFYDPEFLKARDQAREFKKTYLSAAQPGAFTLYNVSEIKTALKKGIPLTLDIDFFYEAWNHRLAPQLGLDRNMDHWRRGIVAYPDPGSLDRVNSRQKPAGHSVVVVGYDDNVLITKDVRMADGSVRQTQTRGVYYIKNSWDTREFGAEFQLGGKFHPGYGMISQQYAHEFGSFFQMKIN